MSEWAHTPGALGRAKPGDLLHIGEIYEKTGGLLKIRRVGSFVAVTCAQAWDGHPIPWPRPEDVLEAIVIEPGTGAVKVIPRDRPEGSSASLPPS